MNLPSSLQQEIEKQNKRFDKLNLGPFACSSEFALRQITEESLHRPPFGRDADKILHSFSYSRFFDKTQVFFWIKSDVFQHRILHVQLVSRIARNIAHMLQLNEDLVEAIALGHDIGYVPMGHDGEQILNNLCEKHQIGKFLHNYESAWFLQNVELLNLTLPVVDGILCHNGESQHPYLSPQRSDLSWDQIQYEMNALKTGDLTDLLPKTLEGCLVRFVDVISYISRDILDAENLSILKFDEIPEIVKEVLGSSNREIINTLINDLVQNSFKKDMIAYSEPVFNALNELYAFNVTHIYHLPEKELYLPTIRRAFEVLWDSYYDDLVNDRRDSKIFTAHIDLNFRQLQVRRPQYQSLDQYSYSHEPPEIIVRDFIAGMTDQYFWLLAKKLDETLEFQPKEIY